jgi:hypothetical protein
MNQHRKPTLEELAAEPVDDRDVAALDRLAAMYDAIDPVPGGLVDRITFAITLDALEAEIAELTRTGSLAGARSVAADDVETITFTSRSLTTMVTISPAGAERVRIDGWVAPGGGVQVELRLTGDTRTETADSDGRFVFDDVPHGLAQFVLRPPAGVAQPPVITPSIEL